MSRNNLIFRELGRQKFICDQLHILFFFSDFPRSTPEYIIDFMKMIYCFTLNHAVMTIRLNASYTRVNDQRWRKPDS